MHWSQSIWFKGRRGDAMSQLSWMSIIQWASIALLIPITLRWLARGRMKERNAEESRLLRLPKSVLVVGLTCFLVFSALAIASNIFSNQTTTWWTTFFFSVVLYWDSIWLPVTFSSGTKSRNMALHLAECSESKDI